MEEHNANIFVEEGVDEASNNVIHAHSVFMSSRNMSEENLIHNYYNDKVILSPSLDPSKLLMDPFLVMTMTHLLRQ